MHEPVVHHELDPRRRDHVEDRGGLECRARQQLQADAPRARRHEIGGVRERLAQRDVAPEPHARAAHARAGQIVVGAVAGAGIPHLPRRRRCGAFERRLLGVVQVLLTQLVAKLDQLCGRDRTGKLVPLLVLSAMDIGRLLCGGFSARRRKGGKTTAGGAAATDTLMPRRIRVNGFVFES